MSVLVTPARTHGQQPRRPRLQAPRQRGHEHVRPVAIQAIQWSREGADAVLLLFDKVFLIAAIVRVVDDHFCRHLLIVGNVKEALEVVEQLGLTFIDFQDIPHDDDAVRAIASRRLIRELGNVFCG